MVDFIVRSISKANMTNMAAVHNNPPYWPQKRPYTSKRHAITTDYLVSQKSLGKINVIYPDDLFLFLPS